MIIKRHKTKEIQIGNIKIGGNNPIAIQSMAKVPTKDYRKTVLQIKNLEKEGCSIVRVAVRDEEDAHAISQIKSAIRIPLVADIHFNWKLAVCAIKSGADKIRLNPGNIYKRQEIKEVVSAARDYSVPIRVGLNSGSIPKIFRYNIKLKPARKLVKAALDYIKLLEDLNFTDIVVSLKCSSVLDTVEAYREIAHRCNYPLHLGLTASGFSEAGKIKSAVAMGILLSQGIGDTLRVSLTDEPEEEVRIAKYILSSLGRGSFGPEIISCPACGRTEVDIEKIVNELQQKLSTLNRLSGGERLTRPVRMAVMGCVVNGPGEAEDADLAIAFGKKQGLLYKNSKPIRKVSSSEAVDELLKEWSKICTRS
ncbi:MAG: 4-hydroxy-3-methylbut-2-en-1-yl diphosphate synthase [Omnitrophica WOR_2 bacterium RIFCSPLOWO2_12_FULL_46_30]|nr:MAG: 4-hydroxy-3-methylbut-2-en-1-yl diphosphate synthase [Omnitrophica WOR_2 bacterium RIFCSPHIGHO2_02_FULL_46_37]OGX44020.1 MAG: 4-hydroxy-3-methylbut-2-en-1-yl diphosphate synthase [Omnitrophica WOR_2 bacterium RIFCSPLOWO2_02_FULL_45_28]OGX51761.1 MAG: 4-hydroxy-3-methylbut-2-en-1-yl diphosphate synthase [Omnitrophica WOR_2 bacterium RIFCSPLOWO2_12_FULL_46_30]